MCAVLASAGLVERDRASIGVARELVYRLYWNSNGIWLACTERDDAPDRIVRGNSHGYPIAWNHLDAEAAHTPAQLGQHFMTSIALHAIQSTAMHRDDSPLHIN